MSDGIAIISIRELFKNSNINKSLSLVWPKMELRDYFSIIPSAEYIDLINNMKQSWEQCLMNQLVV